MYRNLFGKPKREGKLRRPRIGCEDILKWIVNK
jgi:hypothetical protein